MFRLEENLQTFVSGTNLSNLHGLIVMSCLLRLTSWRQRGRQKESLFVPLISTISKNPLPTIGRGSDQEDRKKDRKGKGRSHQICKSRYDSDFASGEDEESDNQADPFRQTLNHPSHQVFSHPTGLLFGGTSSRNMTDRLGDMFRPSKFTKISNSSKKNQARRTRQESKDNGSSDHHNGNEPEDDEGGASRRQKQGRDQRVSRRGDRRGRQRNREPDDDPSDHHSSHSRYSRSKSRRRTRKPGSRRRKSTSRRRRNRSGDDSPSDSPSDHRDHQSRSDSRRPRHRSPSNQSRDDRRRREEKPRGLHFDMRLKPDIVPTWDGDEDTVSKWIIMVNELSQRSPSVYEGLGIIVPTRFRGKAEEWWISLTSRERNEASQNWDTLREKVRTYWMNQAWVSRTQEKALKARFREMGHANELPTEFFIRKLDLLSSVYNFTEAQFMDEFLKKCPAPWFPVLNPIYFSDLKKFHAAIRYNEDHLERLVSYSEARFRKQDSRFARKERTKSYQINVEGEASVAKGESNRFNKFNKKSNFKKSEGNKTSTSNSSTYVADWNNRKPVFPRDDSVVSKGTTPEQAGKRPCLHCGSPKHWDNECKYSKKGARKIRSYFSELGPEGFRAEADYQEAYAARLETIAEDTSKEEKSTEESVSEESLVEDEEHSQDF